MRYLWIVIGIFGIWLLASAATSEGLLPSGHGPGRIVEVVLGVIAIGYAAFRFKTRR